MMILSTFQSYFLPAIVLGIVGAVFGILIAIASEVFYVKPDERVEVVTNMLPGYNCGACGHPGCAGFADAVVYHKADLKLCKPGKEDMRQKIKEYLLEQSKEEAKALEAK